MKYKNQQELIDKIKTYWKEVEKGDRVPAPRSFRIYLGISKHLLSMWKASKSKKYQNFFNLVKQAEDAILAVVEEVAIYGAVHPIIRELSGNSEKIKFNSVGAIFTLKAYDRNLYDDNANQLLENVDAPMKVEWGNKSRHKVIDAEE